MICVDHGKWGNWKFKTPMGSNSNKSDFTLLKKLRKLNNSSNAKFEFMAQPQGRFDSILHALK